MGENVCEFGDGESTVDSSNVDLAVVGVHHEAAVVQPKAVQPTHQRRPVNQAQRLLQNQKETFGIFFCFQEM